MMDVAGGPCRVPQDQNTQTPFQAVRHVHFVTAQQRYVLPSELPRSNGGIFGVEIGRRSKKHTANIIRFDLVSLDHGTE